MDGDERGERRRGHVFQSMMFCFSIMAKFVHVLILSQTVLARVPKLPCVH